MSNDETRGNESPDRQDASTDDQHATRLFRERLETVDHLTTILLEESTPPDTPSLEHLERAETREVRGRLREIRAETNRIALLVIGPEATVPYRSNSSGATTDDDSSRQGDRDD